MAGSSSSDNTGSLSTLLIPPFARHPFPTSLLSETALLNHSQSSTELEWLLRSLLFLKAFTNIYLLLRFFFDLLHGTENTIEDLVYTLTCIKNQLQQALCSASLCSFYDGPCLKSQHWTGRGRRISGLIHRGIPRQSGLHVCLKTQNQKKKNKKTPQNPDYPSPLRHLD